MVATKVLYFQALAATSGCQCVLVALVAVVATKVVYFNALVATIVYQCVLVVYW